ncbi:MAG TPA: DUF3862 domain-containing protein [Pyrinomonadaceae bacterium]|jgi:ABC-type Fe3+-hydroxamate transport system substrate-binding protein
MKKLFEIIRPGNIPALFLILAAAAFIGCASQKNVVTQNGSAANNASDVASRTPEIKTEPRRIESLENHDSEDPAHYKPANNPAAKTVTKVNFDRIKIGMSYREAVEIFGDAGMQTSSVKAGDRETTIFKWAVPDFSQYIDLHFENDKVIEKKQKGLM